MGLAESEKQAEVKRILPRHRFEARMKIEVTREGKTRLAQGWARDLSETGLGAYVGMQLSVGEFASLRIPLPNGIELAVPAQVTRNTGTEYGFQFTALSREQRDQIRSILPSD